MGFMQRQQIINKLMRSQLGLCAGCQQALVTPVIDHDHDTGFVRGLLCGGCNSAEGRASFDNVKWLAYRTNYPAMAIGLSYSYWDL